MKQHQDEDTSIHKLIKKTDTDDDDGASNESWNEAGDSPKVTNMGVVGLEEVPALTNKPVLNKGGVGFANNVEMIQDTEENSLTITSSTATLPSTRVPLSK